MLIDVLSEGGSTTATMVAVVLWSEHINQRIERSRNFQGEANNLNLTAVRRGCQKCDVFAQVGAMNLNNRLSGPC